MRTDLLSQCPTSSILFCKPLGDVSLCQTFEIWQTGSEDFYICQLTCWKLEPIIQCCGSIRHSWSTRYCLSHQILHNGADLNVALVVQRGVNSQAEEFSWKKMAESYHFYNLHAMYRNFNKNPTRMRSVYKAAVYR